MSKMSNEEILQEREELLRGLNPKLIQSLINKSKRENFIMMINNNMVVIMILDMIIMSMQKDIMDGLDQ